MVQPRREGLGLRLGRAIDRWSGGGQRAFVDALKKYVYDDPYTDVPTSYRTLLNYLNETTQPSEAWVEAAAVVLRWNPRNLLTGEEPEREGPVLEGLTYTPRAGFQERTGTLVHFLRHHHPDMPIGAQLMVMHFMDDYFGDDLEGWDPDDPKHKSQVERTADVLASNFQPLFSRPKMSHLETMALAASLTAAAYVRLGAGRSIGIKEEDSHG